MHSKEIKKKTAGERVYWAKEECRCAAGGHYTQWVLRCSCDPAELAEVKEERWLVYC